MPSCADSSPETEFNERGLRTAHAFHLHRIFGLMKMSGCLCCATGERGSASKIISIAAGYGDGSSKVGCSANAKGSQKRVLYAHAR